MLFGGVNVLVYIRKDFLEIFSKGKGVARFEYPKKVVEHSEVFDKDIFGEYLTNFFNEIGLGKQKCLIVLAEDVLFTKSFSLDKPGEIDQQINQFLNKVPFSNSNLVFKKFYFPESILVAAASKDLFSEVIENLVKFKCQTAAVLPIIVFEAESAITDLGDSEVNYMLGNYNKFTKTADFLNSDLQVAEKKETDGEEMPEETHKSTRWIFLLGMLILLTVIGGLSYYFNALSFLKDFNFNPLRGDDPIQVERPATDSAALAPTPTPVSTSSAQPQASESAKLSKENTTILVINGSGIAGQAGRVKTRLEELGYKDVLTETKANGNNIETEVGFKKEVSEEVKNEIISALSEMLTEVGEVEASNSAQTSVVITTGV